MNQLDILYRALVDYRKNTREDRECLVQRSAIITANSQEDIIEVTRKTCRIEEDWVQAIERGIEFIEKAIKEERQFIRSNGEVIPIEKVKRVSKDTIEHLAKHSNLITREPEEGEDVVPDQLYTVERLSDYAVYENRFLYMLLCYLRDFIGMRYERILELTNTYSGSMSMNKTIVESNRKVEYRVELVEEKKNDEYLRNHNDAQDVIDRMLMIYKAVVHFLNTPLMVEVAKAPMLKPPVTRTNVLRMNRNFREALSLYEYISAYEKDGYEILTEIKSISPFTSYIADEIVETVELSSFLTYEHGLGIKDYFRRRYEREEELRRDAEREKFAEQLKSVRRRFKDGEVTPEEFIIMLEKRISDFEAREDELANARMTIDELFAENDKLKFDLKHAKDKISNLEDEIIALNHKYEEDMAAERMRHAEEISAINQAHEEYVVAINERHNEEISEINAMHEQRVAEINANHAEEISAINQAHEEELVAVKQAFEQEIVSINQSHEEEKDAIKNSYEEQIEKINLIATEIQSDLRKQVQDREQIIASERAEFTEKLTATKTKLDQEKRKCEVLEHHAQRLSDEKVLSDGRLFAIRSEYGLIKEDEDLTSKEMIDELENQYYVFKKFFKNEWKKAKKEIRKDVFTQMNEAEETRKAEKERKKQEKVVEDVETIAQEAIETQEITTEEIVANENQNDGSN